MFRLFFLSIIFSIILIANCIALEISKSDSGRTISMSKGDIATIKLAENPTTGYSWIFETEPENQNIISVISSKYIKPSTSLIGAGGIKEYKFQINNPGTIKIRGYYIRPWEEADKNNVTQVYYIIEAKDEK